MAAQIPGYYYDAEKNKYFKIEKSQTAPANASWSASSEKRRKIENEDSEKQRMRLMRAGGKRIEKSVLWDDVVVGGRLRRENGEMRDDGTAGAGAADVKAASWVGGLAWKGEVKALKDPGMDLAYDDSNVECFWVGGEEDGLMRTGVLYTYQKPPVAGPEDPEDGIGSSFIPTSDHGHISFRNDVPLYDMRYPGMRAELIPEPPPCMTSITFSRKLNIVIFTSGHSTFPYKTITLTPRYRVEDGNLDLGNVYTSQYYLSNPPTRKCVVNACVPTPPSSSSSMFCVVATDTGLYSCHERESYMQPFPRNNRRQQHTEKPELFDLDFIPSSSDLILAGGRRPNLCLYDLRAMNYDSPVATATTRSSVIKVKALNENLVLVSSLRNGLGTYDMRWGKSPVVEFPEHKNEAHIRIGLDVSLTPWSTSSTSCSCKMFDASGGGGVVAAAQEDGTVKLFSLTSGRALKCPGLSEVAMSSPLKALMFKTMPGERSPSLFVGMGGWIRKYSWGAREDEDEV